MERFVETPNLPRGRVTSVVMGQDYPKIADAIRELGVNVIELPVNKHISVPVKAHADMSAYYCGNGALILSGSIFSACTAEAFPVGMRLLKASNPQASQYPQDIGLNACEIGELIICRRQYTDPRILEHAEKQGKSIINTNQGYSKCSVCILDERHIITADRSIAKAVRDFGIETLCIEPGFFRLPGYDFGFIGGCSFKTARDTIAFTGSLCGHPNEAQIRDYIHNIGFKTIFLTNEPCLDVGSIIPICEDIN